uniref:RNase H type-1 domain-containing protein n=1 Tax=Solanum lycopersicum TaxID=4081 RepID=A0A3Q7EG92_SOLLC
MVSLYAAVKYCSPVSRDPKCNSLLTLWTSSVAECNSLSYESLAVHTDCSTIHGGDFIHYILVTGNDGFPCSITIHEDVWLVFLNKDLFNVSTSLDVDNVSALMVCWVSLDSVYNTLEFSASILGNHSIRS